MLAEAHGDPPGERRFAVARRPVEEQARAGVDRRPQALEQARVDRDVGKRLFRAARACGASARIVWASTEIM